MVVWTTALFGVVHIAYSNFRIGRFDLGNMVQAVWSTVEGRPLETTDGAEGEQIIRLASHADPFLVLLSPVWVVWPSPLALALAQIAAVALGALPVYWLARRHTGSERTAAVLALAYLAYPWIVTSAGSPIHPVTFAVPLFLYCVWFLDSERLVPFALCAALAMSTGELMGVPVAGLGVWYSLSRGRRRAGAAITALGVAWTVLAIYVIVPAAREGDSSSFYGFYDEVGGSPHGVVEKLVTDPAAIAGALFSGPDIAYLLWLAVPLLGLFVLSPGLAAIGLPQLAANMLSDFPSMTDPRYHTVDGIVPFLVAATVFGVARISPGRRTLAATAVLTTSMLIAVVVGPWPRLVGVTPLGARAPLPSERVDALREAVALIPASATVTASNSAGAHLSARRAIYSAPLVRDATWALVDVDDPWVTRSDSPLLHNDSPTVRRWARRFESPAWVEVYERNGVSVYRRADS
jgi:uncharacterized membrane protein